VAIFGSGGLVGSTVARTLAAFPDITRIVMCDVNPEALEVEAMDVETIAEKYRIESLVVDQRVIDMRDENAIAEFIKTEKPDGIIQAAIPYSWYKISRTLPTDVWHKVHLEGRLGPWLPLFLLLPLKLMRGRAKAGSTVPVVQISFPDAVNPALKGAGLCPTSGAGNSESVATVMRVVAATRLGAPVRDVTLRMVAHHFHSGFMRSPATLDELNEFPLWYRINCAGEDVTDRLAGNEFMAEVRRRFPYQRPLYAATSAAKNMLRILRDDHTITHVCSPGGLPGGFDARLTRNGAVPVWHADLPEAKAMKLVHHAATGDGIQEIAADGSVVFTKRANDALKKYIGYDCPVLRVDETEQRADELVNCLKAAVA
jgi:hypothetical protein